MAEEFELKYACTEDVLDALEASFPGEKHRYTMHTTYYDTPSGALHRRFCTLRQRMENGRSVCTLKRPGHDGAREEFEICCPDIRSAVKALQEKFSIPELSSLNGDAPVPVCGAAFTRIAIPIALPDADAELALDRGVLTGGGRELPFAEVELELKGGSRQALIQYARTIADDYSLTPQPKSKFSRALALAKGE